MRRPRLTNRAARAHFLHRHLLARSPAQPVGDILGHLGFVQVDSINTVARAHDLILWSRRQAYRPKDLRRLVDKDRTAFEHWTHDASILPVSHFPHWRLKFELERQRLLERWREWRRDGFEAKMDGVLARIAAHGPFCSADVGEDEERSSGGWWDWHPSKTALEYHWRTGALAVTKREGFRKYYDLTERVLPASVLAERTEPAETLDWACNAALDRLAFASSGEIAAFWALASPAEAKDWCAAECAAGRIEEIEIGLADGSWRRSFARPGLVDGPVPELSGRLRILSPFDPALRDRKRAERLFGFSYRIEIFVPETKRTYGYYVFPILEGDRLVGRIDMKCARAEGCLSVRALWPEPGVKWGKLRHQKLLSELDRLGGLTGCRTVDFGPGWLRDP